VVGGVGAPASGLVLKVVWHRIHFGVWRRLLILQQRVEAAG
jgi:hypothetical protein